MITKPSKEAIKKFQDQAWDDFEMLISDADAERMILELEGQKQLDERR